MLTGLLAVAMAAPTPAPQKPNIVLFLVDDLGWQDTSVPFTDKPTPFNKTYKTPAIEQLATESVKYTDAYAACAVCTPSRTAIMTGKNPARTHITYWTLDGDTSANDPATKPPRWQWEGLEPKDAPFLPKLLHDGGYVTIHTGKAHFGQIDHFAADPKAIGFDVNIAGHAAGAPGSYYGLDDFKDSVRKKQPEKPSPWDVPGLEKYWGKDIFLTEALADEAVSAVDKVLDQKKPVFLYFAPYAVHAPIMPNKRLLDHYPADMDPRERAYATMIEGYDNALAQIRAEFERRGQWQNTIVIFSSDNGGLSVHSRAGKDDRNAPLRAGKGSFYEGGTRVPLLVRRPGQHATTVHRPVVGTDLFSLVLHEAGLRIPQTPDSHLDRILGKAPERPFVWHMPHFWGAKGQGIEPYSAVRLGNMKLVYRHRDQGFELYDLSQDIGESHNLAAQQPQTVRRLAIILTSQLKSMKAQMPTLKSNSQPVPWPDQALKSIASKS